MVSIKNANNNKQQNIFGVSISLLCKSNKITAVKQTGGYKTNTTDMDNWAR